MYLVKENIENREIDIGDIYVTERFMRKVGTQLLMEALLNHKHCKWLHSSLQERENNELVLSHKNGFVKSTYRIDNRVEFFISTNLFLNETIVKHRDDI